MGRVGTSCRTLEARATPCPSGTFPPSTITVEIRSIIDFQNSSYASVMYMEASFVPSLSLWDSGLGPILLHQLIIGFSPVMGYTGGDLPSLPTTCWQGYRHSRCLPSWSLPPQEASSRCCLTKRASAILVLWLSLTTLVILAAERQAWATAETNLPASRLALVSQDDKDGD